MKPKKEFKIEEIISQLKEKGYHLFDNLNQLNIVGIRSSLSNKDQFDDTIIIFHKNASNEWDIQQSAFTTDPGTKYLKDPLNTDGCAILSPGQYYGAYQIGFHRGKYKALVQTQPVTVFRDNDKDNELDTTNVKTQTGLFGINIHRSAEDHISNEIDGHSAGCQVFADPEDFKALMLKANTHYNLYGNSFTYTLLEAKDIQIKKVEPLPLENITQPKESKKTK